MYRWRTREDAEAQGDEFATALGCSDPTEVLTCLRAKTPADVLRALPIGTEQFAETGRTHWGPVVDGLEIPDQPRTLYEIGAFHRVPIIIGSNRDEGWTWVSRSFPGVLTDAQYESALETEFGVDAQAIMAAYPYPTAENDSAKDTLAQIVTDAEYACGATRLAGLIERTGTPVYLVLVRLCRGSRRAGPSGSRTRRPIRLRYSHRPAAYANVDPPELRRPRARSVDRRLLEAVRGNREPESDKAGARSK